MLLSKGSKQILSQFWAQNWLSTVLSKAIGLSNRGRISSPWTCLLVLAMCSKIFLWVPSLNHDTKIGPSSHHGRAPPCLWWDWGDLAFCDYDYERSTERNKCRKAVTRGRSGFRSEMTPSKHRQGRGNWCREKPCRGLTRPAGFQTVSDCPFQRTFPATKVIYTRCAMLFSPCSKILFVTFESFGVTDWNVIQWDLQGTLVLTCLKIILICLRCYYLAIFIFQLLLILSTTQKHCLWSEPK